MTTKILKIAIFSDTSIKSINGVATSVSTLINVLKEHGHIVYLFVPGKQTKFDKEKNIIYIRGRKLKRIYNYRAALPFHLKVQKLIKELNIDIIHVNTEFGIGIIGIKAAKKYHIPLIYTYHTKLENYIYYIFNNFMENTIIKCLRKVTKLYVNKANEVIVPSLDTLNYLRSCGINKAINVIPTGIDFKKYDIEENIKKDALTQIRNFYKIPDNCKVILCLGRLAKEKSFDVALDRFINYLDLYHDERLLLVVVGDGPIAYELKEQVEKSDVSKQIKFIDKIPQKYIQYYYALADIFLNCSLSETQGLTYMEAIASKLIILTRKAHYLDGVIEDKKDGFFFETQEEFNEKLNYILSLKEEEKKNITNNASKVLMNYSLDTFYEKIMGVYLKTFMKGEKNE